MNIYTKDIAKFLKISLEEAMKVQYRMGCIDFDFSEASDRQFKRAAREAYDELVSEAVLTKI